MVRQDRFLTVILIAIGLLAVAAIALFYTRRGEDRYSQGSTPEDVVHDYVLAIQQGETNQAYTYLADVPTRPTVETFRMVMGVQRTEIARSPIQIGITRTQAQNAEVDLSIRYASPGLFSTVKPQTQTAQLTQEDGHWKIVQMPYPYWSYEWTPAVIPAEPVGG